MGAGRVLRPGPAHIRRGIGPPSSPGVCARVRACGRQEEEIAGVCSYLAHLVHPACRQALPRRNERLKLLDTWPSIHFGEDESCMISIVVGKPRAVRASCSWNNLESSTSAKFFPLLYQHILFVAFHAICLVPASL